MKQLIIEAFELKNKGYYKQAIEIYYKMLAKEGNNIEILSELGELYLLLNNYDRALHYSFKALEIDSGHIASLKNLRKIYSEKKEYEKASKYANKIYILTESQEDLYELISLLNTIKKYDEATGFADFIKSTDVAIEIASSYHNLKKDDEAINILKNLNTETTTKHLEMLCKIYFEINKKDEANEVLKELMTKETNDAEILNYMGLSELDNMNLDIAVEYFLKAIDKEPKNDKFIHNLGQAYFLKGWLDEAKKYFLKAICLNPVNQHYQYSLGYLLYREEDYNNALTHLNSDLLESKVLKMLIKYQQGDLVTAKTELEKLYKDNSDNEIITFALSKIYYNLDLNKLAYDMITKSIELNPKSFEYKHIKANLLFRLEKFDEVKEEIDNLLTRYPNYYYTYVIQAEYLNSVKDFDGLFNVAQKLIEMDLNHYEGYYYNALALVEKNDINFAIESLKKAITLDVNNASLYVKMSEIYQILGEYENAFAYIKEASDIDKSSANQELYMQLANIIRNKKNNN